jgi:hypothetical protein
MGSGARREPQALGTAGLDERLGEVLALRDALQAIVERLHVPLYRL